MKVYLVSKKKKLNATGEYFPEDKSLIVYKGSLLSETISESKTYRGRKSILISREGIVEKNILQEDVRFKSPSTAANFVTGTSSNGNRLWKTSDGVPIGELKKGV